jgi:hypothetical protein
MMEDFMRRFGIALLVVFAGAVGAAAASDPQRVLQPDTTAVGNAPESATQQVVLGDGADFDFPRPSKNQKRPALRATPNMLCDTTCYCNKQCNTAQTSCVSGGGDTCRNGLYCDDCNEGCFASNPC